MEDSDINEPVIELHGGNFNVSEFATAMFDAYIESQPALNIDDKKAREIYDTGFATCRKFFEAAVIPALTKELA